MNKGYLFLILMIVVRWIVGIEIVIELLFILDWENIKELRWLMVWMC